MPSVLVTGANGFIGKACVHSLLAKKYRVFGTDSTYYDNSDADQNYTYVQCEISDKDTVSGIIESNKIDTLVHLGNSVDNDFDSYVTDVELKRAKLTDKYIYEVAAKNDVKNIVLLSTTQIYGCPKGREPIRESSPEKGSSNYVDLKLYSEKMLEKGVKKSDTVPVIARVAPIYTAEYTQNLRDRVYDAKEDVAFIYNDGLYGFTFCCLYNLLDFIKGIVAVPSGRYEGLYNVCDSEVITAKQILDYERNHHRVGAVVQRSPGTGISFNKARARTDYRYFDPATTFNNWRLDNTRAKRIAPLKWTLANTK
ncbi:MAG: NAD(P)-dependent oxidoreductase [Ruminococcus sp.]|nr:NAD(P)-dependent oxidoreductase [Ruminococcus sp.]